MKIDYGKDRSKYGPGVQIDLTGDEVATAINTYIVAHGIHVSGARTIKVNGERCESGALIIDPSGAAIINGYRYSGRGPGKV